MFLQACKKLFSLMANTITAANTPFHAALLGMALFFLKMALQ